MARINRFDRTRPKSQHRVNRDIRFPSIRVIGPDGEQLGIMSPDEGRAQADEYGLDLVEVAPNSRPPVCRIMDYGKFKYELSKKQSSSKSDRTTIKTIQIRPKIDDHDLEVKLKKLIGFLEDGNPVRIVMRLRGRENAYKERWVEQLQEILADLQEVAVVKAPPRPEGRAITAMIEPIAAG